MNFYLSLVIVLFVYYNFWFLFSLIKKRNDIADVAWGIGFVLLAWCSFYFSSNFSVLALVVNFLVSIWGFRLALHIYNRNKNKAEDYRYKEWRDAWGKWFYLRSYLQVYLLQGFFMFLISLPVLYINKIGGEFGFWQFLGLCVLIVGFLFESISDKQLSNFLKKEENKGKLMTSGLWSFSRHPNYFGEVTQWWGFFIMASSLSFGFFTILGPIVITYLILFVSGVPLLEKKMQNHPDFALYKQKTSVFIPWVSKK